VSKAVRSQSHWIRALALCVLSLYEPLEYLSVEVCTRALPSALVKIYQDSKSESNSTLDAIYQGSSDCVLTCIGVVGIPVGLSTERTLNSRLGKLEVLVRLIYCLEIGRKLNPFAADLVGFHDSTWSSLRAFPWGSYM
jgi:hypothetical protein